MDKIEPASKAEDVELEVSDMPPANSTADGTELPDFASPRRRYVGQFIDVLISWGVFIGSLEIMNELNFSNDLAVSISIVLAFSYFVFSDALPKGQSLGKKLINISVVDQPSGKFCSPMQSFLRNVFTPLLGVIDAIFILSKKRQRLGDMFAGTIVVKSS